MILTTWLLEPEKKNHHERNGPHRQKQQLLAFPHSRVRQLELIRTRCYIWSRRQELVGSRHTGMIIRKCKSWWPGLIGLHFVPCVEILHSIP